MLTLAPDMEIRLRNVAAGHGLAPEKALETLLSPALAEAEAEIQETMAGLRQSAADFAAGRWTTPEELDSVLRARQ